MKVVMVDYGLGNMFSVKNALEYCGATVSVTSSASEIENADRLVLPGVGSFGVGMGELKKIRADEAMRKFNLSGRPFLGICLGMQMMFELGEEFGVHEGLGFLPGKVVAIPSRKKDGGTRKIPHVGWSSISQAEGGRPWSETPLAGIPFESAVYFVHSFMAAPSDNAHRVADCMYEGEVISAAVGRDNHFGCQFHPEKSGETGLAIIRNFLRI
jgi:glutamine amidotransferase